MTPPRAHAGSGSRRARGVTLVELLVVLATIAILTSLAIPTATRAIQSARQTKLAGVGGVIFDALQRYVLDHGHPPPPGSSQDNGLNLRTLSPLARSGYLGEPSGMLEQLRDRRVTAYDTPGLPGKEGFWMLLIDRTRPEIQILVASTDEFPLSPGVWIEGIYLVRGSRLERLEDIGKKRARLTPGRIPAPEVELLFCLAALDPGAKSGGLIDG